MKNEEASAKTKQALLKIAQRHFTQHGYIDASLDHIAQDAKLTRGAIYHHFKNKLGLFTAVLESVQQEVAAQIEKEVQGSFDPWEQLILGCRAFVCAAIEKKNKRILLTDAPAVMGWKEWRKLDNENSAKLLQEHIQELAKQGLLQPHFVPLVAYTISGALNEMALAIASYPNWKIDKAQIEKILRSLLSGFR